MVEAKEAAECYTEKCPGYEEKVVKFEVSVNVIIIGQFLQFNNRVTAKFHITTTIFSL